MVSTQYIKNVGKSMGYIAIDTFKKMNPAVAEFYSNAKGFSTDLYQTINDFKGTAVGNDSSSIKSKFKATAIESWQNARDDFLSGKWYNEERKNAADKEMLKGMGIDFDFDFDFDDFGDSEWDDSAKETTKTEIEADRQNTEEIIGAVNSSVASAANSIAAATVKSTEYMAAIQNENSEAIYNLNTKGFNNIGLGLNAINANLSTMLSLAEPLTNHMQNSATFYTRSTELQEETVSLLRKLVDHVVPDTSKARHTKKSIDDYVGDGGINFAAMLTDAKETISSTIKEFKEMADMFGGGEGISKQITASPISTVLSFLLPMLIPSSNKKTMKWFNDSIKSLGYHAYGKLSNKLNDSLIGGILDLFGFSLPTNRNVDNKKLDTSKYEKGKVDWDGKSRKALMEVIPYYLSKMTAIMEGTKEIELFNYETGKFESKKTLQERYDKSQQSIASSYTYEFDSRIKKSSKHIKKADLDELNLLLALSGGNLYDLISTDSKTREKYIKSVPGLEDFFKHHPKIKELILKAAESSDRDEFNKFDLEDILMETGNLRSRLREEKEKNELSGQYDALFRNGRDIENAGLFKKDVYELSALDYLRGIYLNSRVGGGGTDGEIADPLGIGRKINDKIAKSKATVGKMVDAKDRQPKKEENKKASNLREHFTNISNESWEEILKNKKYTDYLNKRYEQELEGGTPDDDNPIWREIKLLDKKRRIKGKLNDLADRFNIGDKIRDFFDAVTDNLRTPAALFDTMITTFRSTLHDIIFSDKGLFGWLFDKEKGVLRTPLKKVFGFIDSRVGTDFTDWFGFDDNTKSSPLSSLNAYNGRVIRRTGLAAVSEGEIIIPAEFNPRYHKNINKAKQIHDENLAISRFYGSFAPGGVVGTQPTAENDKDNTLIGRSKNILKQGFIDFGSMLYDAFSDITGKKDKASKDAEKKNITDIIKGAVDDIKPHAADGILGAMAGGGVSLLTGAVVSPIFGAALGAATGLVMSSEKVRDFLFGKIEVDKKGKVINREGGLFGDTGAKIRRFVEDQLPDTLLGGALGGAGGALLGHPVLGMFLGAGAGFISKSQGVQNFLFGEVDEKTGKRKGGMLSQELQDQIKKAAPGMGAGAVTGIVATAFGGPFGLIGNMLVGSVLGGIASTDSFKNFMFGEKGADGKREGGLVQIIRTSVLDPTRESFFNLTERIRSDFRAIAVGFFDNLKDVVKGVAEGPLGELIRGISLSLQEIPGFKGLSAKAKDFASLRNLSTKIYAGNIRRGINVRDKNGKLLTAKERVDLLKGSKYGKNNRYLNSTGYKTSEFLSRMKSSNSLDKFNDFINEVEGADKETRLKMMSKKKYQEYFDRLGIDENVSKSTLMKMRDAVKVESNARFDSKIVGSIDSSSAINKIKQDINDIASAITGKKQKLFNIGGEEDIDDSTTEGKKKVAKIVKRDKLIDQMIENMHTQEEHFKKQEKFEDAVVGDAATEVGKDKESRKGGLLNKLFGEESVIGKAAKFIADISKYIGVIGIGTLIATATGILDKLAEHLPGMGNADNTSVTNTQTGETITTSSIINYIINKNGDEKEGGTKTNYEDLTVTMNDVPSLSDRAISTIVRQSPEIAKISMAILQRVKNVIVKQSDDFIKKLSQIPGVGKYFTKDFGKGIKEFFSKLGEKVLGLTKNSADDLASDIVKSGASQFDDVFKGVGETAGKTAGKAGKNAGKTIAKKGAKTATENTAKSILDSATIVLSVAFAVIDFTAGMQDAETTMRVKNPTIPERVLCGILRAVKNNIPYVGIVGGLIPDQWIYDLLLNTVGEALGVRDAVKARQNEAASELSLFNETNGTDLDWGQYVRSEQGLNKRTWTEKIGESLKTGAIRTVGAITDPQQYFQNIISGTVEGFKSGTNLNGKIYGALAGFQDNALPGVIGELGAVTSKMWQYAAEGNISALWETNFEAFADDKDPISIMMSNIPLFQNKLIMTPIALVNRMIYNIRDGFKEFDFGNNSFASLAEDYLNINLHAFAGDMKEMWAYKPNLNTKSKFIEGLWDVIMTTQKVVNTPFTAIAWLVKKVWNGVENVKDGVTTGFTYLHTETEQGRQLIYQQDSSITDYFKVSEPSDKVIFKPLFKAYAVYQRLLTIPVELIKVTGRRLYDFAQPIIEDTKTAFSNTITDIKEVAGLAFEGKPLAMEQIKSTVSTSNPVTKFLTDSALAMSKQVLMTPAVAVAAVKLIADEIGHTIENGKTVIEGIKTDADAIKDLAFSGDMMGLLAYDSAGATTDNGTFNFMARFISGFQKIFFTGLAGVTWVGQKIYKFISPMIDDAKTAFNFYKSELDSTVDKIENGNITNLSDLLGNDPISNPENPADYFFNVSVKVARFTALPVALLKATGNRIHTFFDNMMIKSRFNAARFQTATEEVEKMAEDENVTGSDLMLYDPNFEKGDPLYGFRTAVFNVKLTMLATTKTLSDIGKGFKDKINNVWNKIKDYANYDSNSGGGSGFVSQLDPRFANMSLGGYSVGAMGCGPAAASMVLGNSMNANINAARGYQTSGGTDLSYFGDVFSKHGKQPIYYNLAGGASGQDMVHDIASGKPVVLMGRDPYNTSKANSPFGPRNHYVVARGFRNGGIVIDDPESPVGGRVYSPSILGNVSAAVGAGSSGLRRRGKLFGIGAGGAMTNNAIAQQIWAYFKQQGYADGAVAGILGNIQAESSFNLTAQGDKQNGVYTSYGLCQWHNSRWTNLKNYARSIGKDQSDLDAQLGYLKQELDGGAAGGGYSSINDPAKAADQFCRVFERPRYPDKTSPGRQQNAIEFYNAFSGKSYSYEGGTPGSNTGSNVTPFNKENNKPLSAAAKFLGLTSTIGSAFSKAIGESIIGKGISSIFSSAFGGSDNSDTGGYTPSTTSGSTLTTGNDLEITSYPGKQPVEYMRDVLGKLTYSKTNRDPEKGGGDCSSTVAWALSKAGIPVTSDSRWQYMNNTNPYTHPSWQNVIWYDGGNRFENRNGSKNVEDVVNLKPNDVIFYSWKDSKSTYPDHVDHVEMYNGNGQLIGNGGGKGTRTRSVHDMQKDIIKIARPKFAGAGSGLDLSDLRPTGRREPTIKTNGKIYSISEYRRMRSAGASELATDNTALILKTMLTFIEALVTNTKDIKSIYNLLAKYCSGTLSQTETAAALSELSDNQSDTEKIENSLASLKATVDSILAS